MQTYLKFLFSSFSTMLIAISFGVSAAENSSHSRRIAFYTGAFDPIHNGHDEVMKVALRDHHLDLILLSPDPDGNNYKPFISNRQIRLSMLERAYGDHPNIIPSSLEKDGVEKIIREYPGAKIMGIVGSDNILLKISEQKQFHPPLGHPDVTGYLVHVREGDEVDFPFASSFFNREVHPLNITEYPNLSSTKIRNQILGARDKGIPITEIGLPIPHLILKFMVELNPYRNIPNPPSKFTLTDIKGKMGEAFSCDVNAMKLFTRGLSGDLVYRIERNDDSFIAKVLIGMNRDQEFQEIKDISNILQNMNFEHVKFVMPTGFLQTKDFNVVLFPYIKGETIFDLILRGNLSQDLAIKISKALAEFNTKNVIQCTEKGRKAITQYYDKLLKSQTIVKNRFSNSQLSFESIQKDIDGLYENFLKDPGLMGDNHGDSSPTNFIIGADHQIYAIDYGGCCKTMDKEKNPFGFPAHDLYQFISAIFYHMNLKNIDIDYPNILKFTGKLKESYLKETKEIVSKASLEFFEAYYYMKLLTTGICSIKQLEHL